MMSWSTVYTVADVASIATGFITTGIAVYGWWKLRKLLKSKRRIEPVAGTEDVVLIVDVTNKSMSEQVIKYLKNAGDSYQDILTGSAIKRHLDFDEKSELYPGNKWFVLKYNYASESDAHKAGVSAKGRIIEIQAANGHEEMPNDNKELEMYMFFFRDTLKKTLKLLRGSGVSNVHLFMSLPIPLASIIGSELDNNFNANLYHWDRRVNDYCPIGKLQA